MAKIRPRKLALALVLSAGTILLAVACGGGEADTPTVPSLTPSPTATVGITPSPTPFALEPYAGAGHGVSLSVPIGWVIDETDPNVLSIANPTGIATIDITVKTFTAAPTRDQFDEFVSLQILKLPDEFRGYQEISRKRINSPPGFIIHFNFMSDEEEQEALSLYTFNNLRWASVVASTDEEFYDLFSPLFEQVIASINLQPSPPAPTPTPAPTSTPAPTPVPTITPGRLTHSTLGFSVDIPGGWGRLPTIKGVALRLISSDLITVQFLVGEMPSNMTADRYALTLSDNRYEPLSGYSLISERSTTVGGLTARELNFTANTGLNGGAQRYLVVVAKQGTRAFIIEAFGAPNSFQQAESNIRALLESFRP